MLKLKWFWVLLNVMGHRFYFLAIFYCASNRPRHGLSQQYAIAKLSKFQLLYIYIYLIKKIKNQTIDIPLNSLCCQTYLACTEFFIYFPRWAVSLSALFKINLLLYFSLFPNSLIYVTPYFQEGVNEPLPPSSLSSLSLTSRPFSSSPFSFSHLPFPFLSSLTFPPSHRKICIQWIIWGPWKRIKNWSMGQHRWTLKTVLHMKNCFKRTHIGWSVH